MVLDRNGDEHSTESIAIMDREMKGESQSNCR